MQASWNQWGGAVNSGVGNYGANYPGPMSSTVGNFPSLPSSNPFPIPATSALNNPTAAPAIPSQYPMGSSMYGQQSQQQQQQWQQWEQWQQQYAQWHQQYGDKYQGPVPTPGVMPPSAGFSSIPPLPPGAPNVQPPPPDSVPPPPDKSGDSNKRPLPDSGGKDETKKLKLGKGSKSENLEDLVEQEKTFDGQFKSWEASFLKWKEQNANHPDKIQYKEYEAKWESWREQLLQKREQLRKKRETKEAEVAAAAAAAKEAALATSNASNLQQSNYNSNMMNHGNPYGGMYPIPGVFPPQDMMSGQPPPNYASNFSMYNVPPPPNVPQIPGMPPIGHDSLNMLKPSDAGPKITPSLEFLSSASSNNKSIPGLDLAGTGGGSDKTAVNSSFGSNVPPNSALFSYNQDVTKPLHTSDDKPFNFPTPPSQSNFAPANDGSRGYGRGGRQVGGNSFAGGNSLSGNKSYDQFSKGSRFSQFDGGPQSRVGSSQMDRSSTPSFDNRFGGGNFNREPDSRFNNDLKYSGGGRNADYNRDEPSDKRMNKFGGSSSSYAPNFTSDKYAKYMEDEYDDSRFRDPEPQNENQQYNKSNYQNRDNNFGRGGYNNRQQNFGGRSDNSFGFNDRGRGNNRSANFDRNNKADSRLETSFGRGMKGNQFGRNAPDNSKEGFGRGADFDRGNNDFSRGNDDFGGENDDFGDGNNDFNRGKNDFNRGNNDFNRGNNDFSRGNNDFNRGNNDFNRGNSDFNRGNSDFNRGNSDFNRGNSDFNRGNNDFNRGNSEFNRGINDFTRGNNDFTRGNNDFTRGNNDFTRGNNDFNRGSNDFNRGNNDLNRGNNDFNRGNNDFGRESNDIKLTEPSRPVSLLDLPPMQPPEAFDHMKAPPDILNIQAKPEVTSDSFSAKNNRFSFSRNEPDHNFLSNKEPSAIPAPATKPPFNSGIKRETPKPTDKKNLTPPPEVIQTYTPSTIFEYDHISRNGDGNTTIFEPIHVFDYSHGKKKVNDFIHDPMTPIIDLTGQNKVEELGWEAGSWDEAEKKEESVPLPPRDRNSLPDPLKLEPLKNTPEKIIIDDIDLQPDSSKTDDITALPTGGKIEGKRWTNDSRKDDDMFADDFEEKHTTKLISDILCPPGRHSRPLKLIIIMRGPPGSGKTYTAKLIKDKEIEMGGSAPRILSLDDYFMVENDVETTDPATGKTSTKKEMQYEYDDSLEPGYQESLLKSFKKTVSDGFFPFIIIDCVNDKLRKYEEMYNFAKSKGFQVYICEMDRDIAECKKRNIHNRADNDISKIISEWEKTPFSQTLLDVQSLLQSEDIIEVDLADAEKSSENPENPQNDAPKKDEEKELLVTEECTDESKTDENEESKENETNLTESVKSDPAPAAPVSKSGFGFPRRARATFRGIPRMPRPQGNHPFQERRGFGGPIWRRGWPNRR